MVHTMVSNEWRDRLRAKIKESGMSLQAISLAVGNSRNYVRSMLNEGKEPGIETFIQICDVIGANPLEILYGNSHELTMAADLMREFALLTPGQQAGFFALAKSLRPKT